MIRLLAACFVAVLAGVAVPASTQEKQAIRRVRKIPVPGIAGYLDRSGIWKRSASRAIGNQPAAILVFEPVPLRNP